MNVNKLLVFSLVTSYGIIQKRTCVLESFYFHLLLLLLFFFFFEEPKGNIQM
jgi:hypothetical protein